MKSCICSTQQARSISENAYNMFQPSGPNLRRSWTRAWKNAMENSSLRQAGPLFDSVSFSGLNARNVRRTFAFSPFGGSSVILTPFCRTATGKTGEGIAESQSRKSLCILSGENSSTILSKAVIQDFAK